MLLQAYTVDSSRIDNIALIAIGIALRNNFTVRELNLCKVSLHLANNLIKSEGVLELARAMENNHAIAQLNLGTSFQAV